MPLNSPLMLAPLSLTMTEMAELLAAEQPEFGVILAHIEQVKRECSITTSEETIARYERIFALPAGGKTLEERRAALIFYLNARIRVTPAYMLELLEGVLNCDCSMEEHFSEYRFTINIEGRDHSPNMEDASRYVKLLKPSHLEATLRYRQRSSGRVNIAMRAGIGLRLRVKPYQPEDITATGRVHVSIFMKGAQTMRIHPKGV